MSEPKYILEGEFQVATDSAVCFDVDGDEIWIPVTCILDDFNPDHHDRGDTVSVEIKRSIAVAKGLIE